MTFRIFNKNGIVQNDKKKSADNGSWPPSWRETIFAWRGTLYWNRKLRFIYFFLAPSCDWNSLAYKKSKYNFSWLNVFFNFENLWLMVVLLFISVTFRLVSRRRAIFCWNFSSKDGDGVFLKDNFPISLSWKYLPLRMIF